MVGHALLGLCGYPGGVSLLPADPTFCCHLPPANIVFLPSDGGFHLCMHGDRHFKGVPFLEGPHYLN